MNKIVVLSLFLLLLTSSPFAALIERDWSGSSAGNGYLTFDSTTNNEWLDLTLTTGLSYNQVEAMTQVGGQFEGFSIATTAQVEEFFSFFRDVSDLDEQAFKAAALQNSIGITAGWNCLGVNGVCTSNGMTDKDSWSNLLALTVTYTPSVDPVAWAYAYRSIPDLTVGDSTVGAFLYREASPVPVPAAIWLFGSGLLGLAGIARRKG